MSLFGPALRQRSGPLPTRMNPPTALRSDHGATPAGPARDSLFEGAGWFYAFLRSRVFRNDVDAIAGALRLERGGRDAAGTPVLLEVGCGPGFYACHLARRFPAWRVVGLDRSHDQLLRAQRAARRLGVGNCVFRWSDALALEQADGSVDGLLASRLFTVLGGGELPTVLAEMHRVLRPGGRCFLAEPRTPWRAGIPLRLLWLLARLSPARQERSGGYREPQRPTVLDPARFRRLVATQPWAEMRCWEDGHYQYALARKRGGAARGFDSVTSHRPAV